VGSFYSLVESFRRKRDIPGGQGFGNPPEGWMEVFGRRSFKL
jgi:hypothetical protein